MSPPSQTSLPPPSPVASASVPPDAIDCSIPGFPVLHQFPELAQTHVYWVSNAIQPSHPLRCPLLILPSVFLRSGSFPVSQLFTLGGQKIGDSESASVLPMNIQGWYPLGLVSLISLESKGFSRVFSSWCLWATPVLRLPGPSTMRL